jgi:hypothetical protein
MMLWISGLYSINDGVINQCGAVGGMRTGKGNWRTGRKLTPVLFRLPQISCYQVWNWTWVAAVGSQWPATWAMPWPKWATVVLIVSTEISVWNFSLANQSLYGMTDEFDTGHGPLYLFTTLHFQITCKNIMASQITNIFSSCIVGVLCLYRLKLRWHWNSSSFS